MSASVFPPSPSSLFQAAQSHETDLRRRYLALDSSKTDPQDDTRALLELSAAFLELSAGAACLLEAAREEAAPKLAIDTKPYFRSRVTQICGLDLDQIVPRALRTLRTLGLEAPATEPAPPTPEAILRAIRSLLEACPIEQLEALGANSGMQEEAHRCRMAFDVLRAYVVRNDPEAQVKVRLVGRAYSQGLMTPTEAATLLGLPITDTIPLLEDQGHLRSIEVITLSEDERAARLASIRSSRLEAHGQIPLSRDLLVRDVLSSERIEGIDARSWLTQDLM